MPSYDTTTSTGARSEYVTDKDYASLNNVNIQFLSGSQLNLNALIASGEATPGVFYLTNDTHRLYIGRKEGDSARTIPVPVNEGITTVATATELRNSEANVGDFFYIANLHALAVCTEAYTDPNTNSVVRNYAQLNSNTTISSFRDDNIQKNNGDVAVSTSITDSENGYVAKTFHFIDGSNITIDVVTNNDGTPRGIRINGVDTTYTFTTKTDTTKGVIELIDNSNNSQEIHIESDSLTVTSDNTGTVQIERPVMALGNYSAPTGYDLYVTADGTAESNSHLRIDPQISYGKNDSRVTVTTKFVSDNGSTPTATLDVYTAAEVDAKIDEIVTNTLQTNDAMVFKGVVDGGLHPLPDISTLGSGDTYKVGDATSATLATLFNNVPLNIARPLQYSSIKTGDLLIATGTEGSDGKIDPLQGDAEWVLIPAGDEASYAFNVIAHGIKLRDSFNQDNGSFALDAGTNIVLSDRAGTSSSEDKIVTVSHETISRTDNTLSASIVAHQQAGIANSSNSASVCAFASTQENNLYTGLQTSNGHITGLSLVPLTIYDTHANLSVGFSRTSSITGGIRLASVSMDTDSRTSTVNVDYKSDTLSIVGTTEGVGDNQVGVLTLDLKWGTF